ncbi:hypothetical protein IFM89_027186, partial [Coptis chinensis]
MASSSQRRGSPVASFSSQHPQHRIMPQRLLQFTTPHKCLDVSFSSHQPNVSQPSESAGDNTLRSSNGKLPIIAHADGRITGVYSAKWSSRVGYWIRAIVPISYASWDKVDGSFKDEVWLKLMEEFQLNVNPTMGARKNIEKWFAPKFRYWKYAFMRIEVTSVEETMAVKKQVNMGVKWFTTSHPNENGDYDGSILEHVKLNGSANGQPSTPTTEVDSTSVPIPRTQQVPNLINRNGSLNPPSRTSYPNVKILGRKGEHVANGYVKTDGQKCHFRDIMGDEKVVYITNVLVGDAPVYDGPRDDILYLRDIVFGGFLIWGGGSCNMKINFALFCSILIWNSSTRDAYLSIVSLRLYMDLLFMDMFSSEWTLLFIYVCML